MSDTAEVNNTAHASHVAIKIPSFDSANIKTWFRILESQFKLARITSSATQFHHLLSNIPLSITTGIAESVLDGEDYEKLKTQVLQNYEKSKHDLFDEFVNKKVLDCKPSVFLNDIQIAGHKVGVSEDIIRRKFEKVLPTNIAPVVAAQKNVTLTDLGKLADDLMNLCATSNSVNSINSNKDQEHKYQKINYQVRPFSGNQRPKVCRSHIYYGKAAKFCRFWCQWPDKNKCKIIDTRTKTPNNSPVKQQGN